MITILMKVNGYFTPTKLLKLIKEIQNENSVHFSSYRLSNKRYWAGWKITMTCNTFLK